MTATPSGPALAGDDEVGPLKLAVEQQLPDFFGAVDHADQPGPVKGQRRMHEPAAAERHEFLAGGLGARCVDEGAAVHLRQRADPVPAIVAPQRTDMRELHVAPRTDFLDQIVAIVPRLHVIEDRLAAGIDDPEPPVIEFETAVLADQAHVAGLDGGKAFVQRLMPVDEGFVQLQGVAAPLDDLVDILAQTVAALHRQVLG